MDGDSKGIDGIRDLVPDLQTPRLLYRLTIGSHVHTRSATYCNKYRNAPKLFTYISIFVVVLENQQSHNPTASPPILNFVAH
jgi:hypothetical protein